MKKHAFILSLCLSLLLMAVNVYSTIPIDYSPQWNCIYRMSSTIGFDGLNGEADASVFGKSGTTHIDGTLTVYRQSGNEWVYVDSTSDSVSQSGLGLQVNFTGISGAYYKAVFEVSVICNGVEESTSKTSYKTCP